MFRVQVFDMNKLMIYGAGPSDLGQGFEGLDPSASLPLYCLSGFTVSPESLKLYPIP